MQNLNKFTMLKRLFRDNKAALNEFIGLIIFLIVIFVLLVPVMIELMSYMGQAQELDRLTKIAAKRACSLLADPSVGTGGDVKQGGIGMAVDISIMQPLVDQVFLNEASHPKTYFENAPAASNYMLQNDGQPHIQLTLFDYRGQEVRPVQHEVEDSEGNTATVLMVGSNAEGALCPSIPGKTGWNWCLEEGTDDAIKEAVRQTGIGQPNQDLIQRQQRFQAGRCRQGENCKDSFVGRVDRCSVCATKTRQSIFAKQGLVGVSPFAVALACNGASDQKLLPCSMSACANEKLLQLSAKRGYNTAYQQSRNLGQGGGRSQYNTVEVNPRERQSEKNTLLNQATDLSYHKQKASQSKDKEATTNLFHELNDQFAPVGSQ